jgi:hypothetical protein
MAVPRETEAPFFFVVGKSFAEEDKMRLQIGNGIRKVIK